MLRPPHHRPDGRFRAPWPEAAGDDAIRTRIHEVARQWITTRLPPDPRSRDLPTAVPSIAEPCVGDREARGHVPGDGAVRLHRHHSVVEAEEYLLVSLVVRIP